MGDGVGMGASIPVAAGDGGGDNGPEEVEGAAVLQLAAGAAGAQEDGGEGLGDDPGPVGDVGDEVSELDGIPLR